MPAVDTPIIAEILPSLDSEVVQYLVSCLGALPGDPDPLPSDVADIVAPFAQELELTEGQAAALCSELRATSRLYTSVCMPDDNYLEPAPEPKELGNLQQQTQQKQPRQEQEREGQERSDDEFILPKKTARPRRAQPSVQPPTHLTPEAPQIAARNISNQQQQPSEQQQTHPAQSQAAMSYATDIASALSEYCSRKQLRRFSAELGLQADEPGGLVALLAIEAVTLQTAAATTIADSGRRTALLSYLQQLTDSGQASDLMRQAKAAGGTRERGAATGANRPHQERAPPPALCCVECHTRTPFVFTLLGCRLCEACERTHPDKYGVVEMELACRIHALTEPDLRGLRSVVLSVDTKRRQRPNGKGNGGPRLFLRSEVEACVARIPEHSRGQVAERHQRVASAEWRENSFKKGAKGKTHKWKAWNSPTHHMQRSAAKHVPMDMAGASSCVGLSALKHVGFS